MVNYAFGKVYKFVNNVDEEIYVGSTCNPLHKRKWGHKTKSKQYPNYPVYQHLNRIGWDNVEIVLIENVECKTKNELHRRERYWIDILKPSLNKVVPLRTKQEYYQSPSVKERIHTYRQMPDVKKKSCEMSKRNYHERGGKARAQEYMKGDTYKNIKKVYRVKKIECECGSTFRNGDTSRHITSKKHKQYQKIYDFIFS